MLKETKNEMRKFDHEKYEKICQEVNNFPKWKRDVYNNDYAVSTNAKKVPNECNLK